VTFFRCGDKIHRCICRVSSRFCAEKNYWNWFIFD